MTTENDIFLSYKSEDSGWVERLKRSLEDRGVFVWLDKDSIRPGDLFVEALEDGIITSKTVAVIVTPNSMQSKWVKEEYHRALSLSKTIGTKVVPCILQTTEVPGFLSSRQYIDFTDETKYEQCVDRLVCPGITRKWIHVETFTHNIYPHDWVPLNECSERELGFSMRGGLSCSRMGEFVSCKKRGKDVRGYGITPGDKQHSVVVLDMTCHGVDDCVEFILECRNSNDGVYDKIVFVFYHPRNFLSTQAASKMSKELLERFSHYYVIEKSGDLVTLQKNVRRAWNSVLQDLIRAERTN
ncbi:MAG TPA: toll/interleukin-1 receptor domain-containing protein [Balneolales bacterium]|nr:toll/interleukin-1 receptor domain-containing protein [Balneolales bacterium]